MNPPHSQVSSHFGNWSPNGLPNLQRAIPGVKNHCWRSFLYHWKVINEGYNFALNLTSIEGLHTTLWASKVAGVPILGISGLPFWSPGTKWHLGAGPMARHREYYKGGRWWLPSSSGHGESCESLFRRDSSVHQKCSSYALTNLLFGLCRSVWVINLLVILPSPYPGVSTCPSTPEVVRVKEHASTPYPSVVFTFRLPVESTKEFGGALLLDYKHD
jgi:hypothetical protein